MEMRKNNKRKKIRKTERKTARKKYHLVDMPSLSLEAIQCRIPAKSYDVYLR